MFTQDLLVLVMGQRVKDKDLQQTLPPYLWRDHKMQIIKKYLFLTQQYKYECKNSFDSTKVYCYCFIVHSIEKGMQLRKHCKLLTEEGDFWWINIVWLNVRFKASHCLLYGVLVSQGLAISPFPSVTSFRLLQN